ncbi:hypothetical protein ABT030_47845 [Streptomyces mirabilis]|uniref:hypothetical protein n=1 Tax=Streptomyces mirabilis TaxID=68239 RepID=UPI0033259BE8
MSLMEVPPLHGRGTTWSEPAGAVGRTGIPPWPKGLIERVRRLLPVDPSSACQRLLNAAVQDLREKVQIAGFGLPLRPDLPHDRGDLAVRDQIARRVYDAYFSLTLLEIFGAERLERRSQLAALHGPDGDPDRLAQARQELGISPYSARSLIDSIRKAWSLPLTSAGIGSSVPLVAAHCARHGVTTL